MTTEAELLEAIRAEPTDGARLVYADWLLAKGDPRGTLIVLDCLDRTKRVTDPEALTQFVRLAAEHGFPHLPDPDAHMLAWEFTGPRAFVATWERRNYRLLYGEVGKLDLFVDGRQFESRVVSRLRMTDEETNVILAVASRAIRAAPRAPLMELPTSTSAMQKHPDFRPGPFPRYPSHEIAEDFGHPEWTLAARDYHRWYKLWERLVGPPRHDL